MSVRWDPVRTGCDAGFPRRLRIGFLLLLLLLRPKIVVDDLIFYFRPVHSKPMETIPVADGNPCPQRSSPCPLRARGTRLCTAVQSHGSRPGESEPAKVATAALSTHTRYYTPISFVFTPENMPIP
jgi:hypothetical protein